MQIDFVRRTFVVSVVFLGAIAIPAAARGEDAEGSLSRSPSPSFSDLSSNLSLAMPQAGPGLWDGQAPATVAPRQGRLSAKTGLGFTLSPDESLLVLEADYFISNNIAIGPLVQFGVDNDPFIFAPTINVMGMFDLPGADLERLKPFIQGGIGLAYYDEDRAHHPARDDVGFMFNIGGGIEYFVTDRLSLGNNILFNVMPDDVLGDHFFFSWQFVTVRFLF